MEFYEKVSPTFPIPLQSEGVSRSDGVVLSEGVSRSDGVVASKRYVIPPPTLCPDCRQQRRIAFRNERKLYKRKCDATGKEMLSMFPPTSNYKVYSPGEWYKYDFMKEGVELNLDESFFEQFNTLLQKVPHMGLSIAANENCDFTNQCGNSKNCYYSFDV